MCLQLLPNPTRLIGPVLICLLYYLLFNPRPESQNGNMMVRPFDGGPAPFIPLKSASGRSASCRGLDDA
ncbi:uncharacterized protein BDW70DRAFT_145756 [Aspergillus foveolatus]|uniref:uncharacterized protein n=1 Tax=Aspergillus foveolatus TaxID=210207 RepID=UPI003CCD1346